MSAIGLEKMWAQFGEMPKTGAIDIRIKREKTKEMEGNRGKDERERETKTCEEDGMKSRIVVK